MPGTIIVGAGHAGVQVADSLRREGYRNAIMLMGDETHPPYQRPPLSKEHLLATGPVGRVSLRGPSFFAESGIELRTVRAVEIDRAHRRVRTSDGVWTPYARLVLATGARNRALEVPGAGLTGVLSLRTADEADAIRGALAAHRRIGIIGAGFIGMEVAAAARERGLDVTVVSPRSGPMARSASPTVVEYFTRRLVASGARLVSGTEVRALRGNGGRVDGVVLADDRVIDVDVVVVGIGVHPNDELAARAGLQVDDGVVVDAGLRTSDPRIWAIGDCATHPNPHAGVRRRIESVQNALDQGRHVARAIAAQTNETVPYRDLPWFWSHQGGDKLTIAGISSPADELLVLGDLAAGSFSVLRFREGRLRCVESVNAVRDHLAARAVLGSDVVLTSAQARLEGFRLADFARAPAKPR
ncbi:NAD(P)/FAD-dependent oxidoreductase [Microbacterium allomyrinae]|uniref:FAD-dependent oxidoreductase n=1 Tax=Microbacterium allomyrinae TaxID=2830666 RepID=A0A9X1S3H0_9MICO|nr:FAD-dependent oxidoreductase [Microbacterium allomyrinae]MCC2033179.1 FAD-dependent oxidoreductase [Microbacterium allomyrinae]